MAAIAIDARSKFKRTYFPNCGDRAAGAMLLLLYLERVSEQPTDVRFRASGYRDTSRRELQWKREIENRERIYVSHVAWCIFHIINIIKEIVNELFRTINISFYIKELT